MKGKRTFSEKNSKKKAHVKDVVNTKKDINILWKKSFKKVQFLTLMPFHHSIFFSQLQPPR